jgi:endonuclease YncB( thermonuclease family)
MKVNPDYIYPVEVLSIVDGDTYWFNVILINEERDYGFGMYGTEVKSTPQKFRLRYYDTAESRGASKASKALSKKATEFVEKELADAISIKVHSHKDKKEKWGRYLAEVKYLKSDLVVRDLGEELKKNKLLKSNLKEGE